MKKLLVVLLVLGLASPVMAGQWQFKGSLRTHIGYYDVDENYGGGPAMDGTIAADNVLKVDDKGTLLSLSGQSRFQAVGIASDKLIGVIEAGLEEGTRGVNAGGTAGITEPTESVYLRLAYGTWNFGSGKLIVGKNYTPGTYLGYSSMQADLGDQGDANMLVAGLPYIGRVPQIRLAFGGFDIALIEPNGDAGDLGYGDIDFTIPRIEASYVFRTDLVNIRPVAGYQVYDIENNAAGLSETITSYLAGLGASFKLGAGYVKATVSYMQNPANYGHGNVLNVAATGAALNATGGIEDATLLQGTLVAGMKFSDTLGVEIGGAYGSSELADLEQQAMLYYLQVPITVAQGVQIIPEVGQLDRDVVDLGIAGVPDRELGKMFFFDVNFRVDF